MPKTNLTAIIIVILVVAGGLAAVLISQNQGTERTVSATGNSQMTVAPDEAIVYLWIQTKDISAEQAKNDNARISDDVLTALIKKGIEKKDIETENYNIYPEYDWVNREQKFKGYVASNYMKITTADFNNVGKIVDASVDAGALVNYINFELSNAKLNEYKAAALADASKDAKAKAEAVASGLGKELGSLVSVSSSEYNYAPYPLYRMEAAAEGVDVKTVATDIQPKNLEVTATVSVVYEIK